eukprot:94458_1
MAAQNDTNPSPDDKDKDMIANDENKSNKPTPNKCICGAKLILKQAQNCYEDSKEIECDKCSKTIKGNTKVYHCINKETTKHTQKYDLCANCALPSIRNIDEFDSLILETLSNKNKNKLNLILSPFSILIAMSICMLGANKNTLKQMLNVLHPNRKNKSSKFANSKNIIKEINKLCKYFNKQYTGKNCPIVKIANKIWISNEYKILNKYIDAAGVNSIGSMHNNAAKSANMINNWCCDNTKKMIKKVVTANDIKGVLLVITNAIYFKGKFINAFSKKNTQKNVFYQNKSRKKVISTVKMMYSKKKSIFYSKI